jgi:hypothetical protein
MIMDGTAVVDAPKLIVFDTEPLVYSLISLCEITMEPCLNGPLVVISVLEPVK